MSNHCIDVVCLVCGKSWCDRCGQDGPTYSEDELLLLQNKKPLIDVQHCGSKSVVLL